jgi:hypothetical protein
MTYTDLSTTVKPTPTAATAEACMVKAIREINLRLKRFNQELPQMTGVSGSMTVNLDDAEIGAVVRVATSIYYRDVIGPINPSVGGVSYSVARVDDMADEAAAQLKEIDVSRG